MNEFFRFPHTQHLAWLGAGSPRDDKVMSPSEAAMLLADNVVVEEKVDGANLGISVGPDCVVRVQNRGQYLESPYSGQFSRLDTWMATRKDALRAALGGHLILFGEWCAARHSLAYPALADWFMAFDVYDRNTQRFWSTARRNMLADGLRISSVPIVFVGRATVERLTKLVRQERSRFRPGPLEGLVIRKETAEWLEARAKLVHPDFTQTITEHWSRRAREWNRLAHLPELASA